MIKTGYMDQTYAEDFSQRPEYGNNNWIMYQDNALANCDHFMQHVLQDFEAPSIICGLVLFFLSISGWHF